MNYWHLAGAISIWLMAVGLGWCSVLSWNIELDKADGTPDRTFGPVCCGFLLIIAGLYVGAGFAMLSPGN